MSQSIDPVTTFRRLFLAHRPTHQAWMQPAGAAAKYRKKFHPISDVELAAHLAGRLTIAAPLLAANGTAHAAALDIDAGGHDALWHVMEAAQERGLTAFALTSTHATHHGGHVWLLFDAPAAPGRLRHLADELAHAATVVAETYPSGRTLRLPLDVHRGSLQRDHMLLPDGHCRNLDAGSDTIATALAVLDALPRNGVAMLPPEPLQRPRAAPQTRPDGSHAAMGRRIAAYNVATDLLGLLEGYGGRIAEQYRGGRALMHCPCGQHRNGDAHASLEIQPARNARYGQSVARGYAPSCAFSIEQRGAVDAFAVYCHMEQLRAADALRLLVRRGMEASSGPGCSSAPAAVNTQLPLDSEGGRS